MYIQKVLLFFSFFFNTSLVSTIQGTHYTGKTRKMAKKVPCQGKHREFGNVAKTQGKHREFGFCSGCKFPDFKNILKFAAKISKNLLKLDTPAKSVLCMYSHKSCKLLQEKFAAGQGKNRENTGICLCNLSGYPDYCIFR